ncbi:hypothetical protein RHO12_06750 [Orbus sturtevantii]|uniref:RCC1 domain-containing protein n=1 Tax=Orbus sturtevantii TaxID=3074109 RepID=UPI00370D33B2
MIQKLLSFLLINLFITGAYARTDATLLSTKTASAGGSSSRTNTVNSGAIIENGDVWVWGYRDGGISGNQYFLLEWDKPERVSYFVSQGKKIIQIAGGVQHFIALDMNGDVWGWGHNGYNQADGGQCGSKATTNSPCQVLQGKDVIQIHAGEYVSYALTKNGEVYTWGHSSHGEVGNGTLKATNNVYQIPQNYFNNKKVVLIGAAYEGGYAINKDGEIFGWGDEQANSFGYDTTPVYQRSVLTPKKLNISIDGKNITYICGGEGFTEYLTENGDVYGIGELSRIGQGVSPSSHERTATPVKIMSDVQDLYCRYAGSTAVRNNDSTHIYTWGSNGSNDPYFIYGSTPQKRIINGKLVRLDGGKDNLYYLNDNGEYYGVGYGGGNKFAHHSNTNIDWPGKRIDFLDDAVKEVYGQDYIIGQEDINKLK